MRRTASNRLTVDGFNLGGPPLSLTSFAYCGPGPAATKATNTVPVTSSGRSHDEESQRRLWAVSEELTGVTFPV
jgi:hypothetical protein